MFSFFKKKKEQKIENENRLPFGLKFGMNKTDCFNILKPYVKYIKVEESFNIVLLINKEIGFFYIKFIELDFDTKNELYSINLTIQWEPTAFDDMVKMLNEKYKTHRFSSQIYLCAYIWESKSIKTTLTEEPNKTDITLTFIDRIRLNAEIILKENEFKNTIL